MIRILIVLSLTLSSLAFGQYYKKTAAKKKTVGDVLESIDTSSRGNNVIIKKKSLALPDQQNTRVSAVPIQEVKPPRSQDIMKGSGTDEENIEQMTDEAIKELYSLTQRYSKSKNRGQLWLRLAEQYVEKAKYIELRIQKDYDKKLDLYHSKKGPRPRLNLNASKEYNTKAIKLYEWFLRDFPQDPRADQALFFLGYNYMELDQFNRGVNYYKKLATEYSNSPYVGEANFALGEYYFDNNRWKDAYKAYADVLKNRRARLYTFALFKMAWCQYRLGRSADGMKTLEEVVRLSRGQGAEDGSGRKPVSKIRLGSEALKDMVLFFADTGQYNAAEDYFLKVGGEQAYLPMLEKLAYFYSDQGKKEQAEYIFKQLLEKNPKGPKAFDYQYQIVQNYATTKNQTNYRQELYTWIDNYGPGSEWYEANKGNKKLVDEAYTQRESSLRNYALLLHKNAQNSQKKNDLIFAREAYRLYLAKFQDSPKATEMHFFYGELLYNLTDYENAGKEYKYVADKDPKGKYYELAVLNSLLSLEKGLKNDEQTKQMVGDRLDPVPFSDVENTFIAAAEKYVNSFPRGEKAVDVKFKIGRLEYSFNHFDDSLKMFRQIIAQYPRTPFAVYSANLILDVHNLRKDYDSLAKDGNALMKNSALTEQGFKTDVANIVERAGFKKAQDLESAKNYEASGKAFSDFVRNYPRSELATSAAYNSGINYERAGKIPEAVSMYVKVVNSSSKTDEKLKQKSTLLLGRLFEQTGQFEKAAVLFEKYAKENKGDHLTPDLYFNAAVIWESQKEYGKALDNYEKYFETSKRRDRNIVLFTMAKIHEKENHLKLAEDYYQKYISTGDSDGEKIVEAHFKVADLAEKRGNKTDADKAYAKTVAVQRNVSQRQGKGIGQIWAAEAKFKLIQKTYNELVSVKIPANPQKQAAALKQKLALLTRLSQELAEVIKYDEGNMVIASLTTLGKAYEHMAATIYSVPLPKDLNAQEMVAYKKALDDQAAPFIKQATDNYLGAINKSYEINYYNQWTKLALDAMGKRMPDKFVEPKEIVTPISFTDTMGI